MLNLYAQQQPPSVLRIQSSAVPRVQASGSSVVQLLRAVSTLLQKTCTWTLPVL
jgi:hypothetical protein